MLLLVRFSVMANEPEKRPGTDAMLFGDVKSAAQHIPFATVTIKGTTIGTAADATGHFKMTNLPEGEQIVIISAIGYKTAEKRVQLKARESVTILVELEADNIGIEQVVVSADRNSKNRRETATIVNSIGPKLFERTQSVTLSEGLNFTPGLRMENNCQNCGFSQVRMNGMEGPYSQILINSRPVFSGLAGVYGLELIPANMIERVEVVRGGGSAMYGSNAIAGTINLITKDPVVNSFSVASAVGGVGSGIPNSGGATLDYHLNFNGSFVTDDYKSGISLYGFTRKRDPFDANGDGFSELSVIENNTMGARFFQRLADRAKLSVDYFNIHEFRRGGNKFDLPLHESDVAESTTYKINSGAFTFDQLLREEDKLTAWLSAQAVDRAAYYGANQDLSAYGQTDDFTFSTGLQYIRNLRNLFWAPATLTSGVEWNGSHLTDQKLGYYDPVEELHFGNTRVADQKISSEAAFFQSEWKWKSVVLATGLRFDHYAITDRMEHDAVVAGEVLSPRISLLVNLHHNLQLRSGFARGFRAPQIFDEDLHIETSGARQVLHRNADDLKQETSNSFSFSLDYSKHAGRWQYQLLAEGFYTQLKNPFANEYGEADENGMVVYTRVNARKGAVVQGINFELNASPSGRLQFQSGLTLQKSEYEEAQEFNEKRFFRSPGRYGYVSLNYSPSLLFDIALTGNYTGPMLVPYFGPRLANPEEGELNRSGSFYDAGLKLSYHLRLTDAVKVRFNAGVRNLLNSYQDDFDTGVNRDPAYLYGPTSPRTIYLGLKFGSF